MKTNVILLTVIVVLLIAVLIIIVFFTLQWFGIYTGIKLLPDPPSPEITYGEFPVRLEYEINGQRMVIQDTLICEYDGIGSDEGRGKYRKWKKRLASGNQRMTLLKVDNTKEIYYTPGSANYYMGDLDNAKDYKHSFPDAAIIENDGRITSDGIISSDELLSKYNIKLISWDYSQPITNNFPASKK